MQGIQSKKFGGEDFGSTLEELKKIAPLAVTMDGVKFEGPARKVGAILALAGVGVELIAEIERLAVDAERFAIIRAMMCDTAFQEALAPLIISVEAVDDPNVEQLEAQFDLHIKIAKDAGLWPIKPERVLTEEAQADRDEFNSYYGSDGSCSCHISPPCGSCVHPGNPLNQDEDESCWTVQP